MTLCINQVPVDFTLENEATLAELETSLRSWARSQGLTILSFLADGRAQGDEPRPLDGLSRVDVEVVPAEDELQARLEVLTQYLDLVARAAEVDQGTLTDLKAELGPVVQALENLGLEGEALKTAWPDARALASVAEDLGRRLRVLPHPTSRDWVATLGRLEVAGPSLTELPDFFQKGRDQEAFDRILVIFTDLMRLGIEVESALSPGVNRRGWDEFQSSLTPFLKEAEGAMETQDYVLLTDLLEYEIAPRISEIRPLLSSLINLDPRQDVL
jgi:hypothetical protein